MLRGTSALQRRLRAIKTVFKPLGRRWADETVSIARSRVKVVTGKTRNSIRRKNASMTKASVQAGGGARFLEVGAKPHGIKPRRVSSLKFTAGGQAIFRSKVRHPGSSKQPFLKESGADALQKMDILRNVIDLWNRAA